MGAVNIGGDRARFLRAFLAAVIGITKALGAVCVGGCVLAWLCIDGV